ncbi:hypothetical protein SAMN04489729_4796 [Amycolatopsis lurida]|uniref:Uncharacterized protein n=1 Tax=Amycolatopsis lurida NRRL 2430 TaxID=1460371 RepID=A0A2P2FWB7_AMYLU|nr:hypothetical protein [Amycolatopsis lurida]KFU81028.1 hypothetical protein BB31_11645 [Amycolatopsis lurida NRRL 2430]SED59827.1 hypothetical protein SAMN04489729_4796 [Amycolatopsis lurida]
MHERDRKLLAGMAHINAELGNVTIALLSTQPDDAEYAAALRQVATNLIRVGVSLLDRATELDGMTLDPGFILPYPAATQGDLP